ncbi:hypothetical protein [Natrinema salsiterrestre]|uniref:Uncharacterized protein n=1 Tax=Natrinema salsiterrestre TaxID=2950540 RepID=A0A9Q4L4R0_9EURY|nr:hypothetical protein [Natrinema salsiterrestre]MDF9746818.1 hypothetical protein [Natrinema salsiterrestre]
MSGPRELGSKRCLECGAVLPIPDPIVGWWLCDDCELAFNSDGERVTER